MTQTLGSYLRAAREAAGLSIRQVAALAGLSHGFLVKVENDQKHPSAANLQRLAEVLEADTDALFRFIGVRPSSTLPPPRVYFRRKFGMNEADAEELAHLIEEYTTKHHKEIIDDDENA